jgi:hypothetical protein
MRCSPWFGVLAFLALGACASDESSVCERLAECDLLPEGLSESECEDQAVRQVPEERLSKCSDCVEKNECKTLVDACGEVCEPGD